MIALQLSAIVLAKIPDVYMFGLFIIVGVVLMGVTVTPLPTLGIAVGA